MSKAKGVSVVHIDIVGGVAHVIEVPKGVTVVIRDYDCVDCQSDKNHPKDMDGKHYHMGMYHSK